MADLRTDFVDDVLDTTQNLSRVYNIKNRDGSVVESDVIIEDVSVYTQQGSTFGASAMNETNQAVNELNNNLTALGECELLGTTKSTSDTNIININDINNYRFLYMECMGYSDNTVSGIMPTTLAKTRTSGTWDVYSGINYRARFKYKTDTSCALYVATSGETITAKLYGIK